MVGGKANGFLGMVGLHQGSDHIFLSVLRISLIEHIQEEISWCVLIAMMDTIEMD